MSASDDDHTVRIDKTPINRKGVLVVVAIALAVLVVIALFVFVIPEGGEAHMTGVLDDKIELVSYSHHTAVRVTLSGWITNDGSSKAAAEVVIEVFDGSVWTTYTETTDRISGDGGTFFFLWAMEFLSEDASQFKVRYTISAV